MKIKPLENIVYLKIEKPQAGVLDTSSRESAVEFAEVLAVADNITSVKPGDQVFVKSWAIDIITHKEVKHYFVNVKTNGILAIVR